MQKKIKNREALLSHGDINGRKIVLDITEKTLQHLDAYERIKSIAHMEGDTLCIGSRRWDLSKKRNVYLLGAGKACDHMAMAVDEILGDHLTRGIAIVKIKEDTDVFRKTDVYVGGHPLPNEEGLRACKEIIKLVDSANEDDLFIVVISGGSSALMSCPIEGITLQDEIDTTDVMLKSGAGIYEINAIRRHISAMNGGMLAKRIRERGAELIGFGISDAVGTPATGDIGAIDVLRACAGSPLWAAPLSAMGMDKWEFVVAAVSCIVMLIADTLHFRHGDQAERAADKPWPLRCLLLLALLFASLIFGSYGTGYDAQSFIYGQF